jgi:hypothetical protein
MYHENEGLVQRFDTDPVYTYAVCDEFDSRDP